MISLKYQTRRRFMALIAALALLMLQGCAAMVVGAAVGAAATVAVETAKVPFKVTGAAIDLATDDEED